MKDVLKSGIVVAAVVMPGVAAAAGWVQCGSLVSMANCEVREFPATKYEYGLIWNGSEPTPIACIFWNFGERIHNKQPYFVGGDDPSVKFSWGGFMFYRDTLAKDDDECSSGTWKHRYWSLNRDNAVVPGWSTGCVNAAIYCRSH